MGIPLDEETKFDSMAVRVKVEKEDNSCDRIVHRSSKLLESIKGGFGTDLAKKQWLLAILSRENKKSRKRMKEIKNWDRKV